MVLLYATGFRNKRSFTALYFSLLMEWYGTMKGTTYSAFKAKSAARALHKYKLKVQKMRPRSRESSTLLTAGITNAPSVLVLVSITLFSYVNASHSSHPFINLCCRLHAQATAVRSKAT